MIINIDAPVKQENIKNYLESLEDIKYKYIGTVRRTTLQFEIDEKEFAGDPIAITKGKIKAGLGNMIVFRVLEDGKNW